ncbi:type II toxin-antitoxin system HigA family antitoxin [Desulfuromonas sp. TF]|uniref:helix-turn-helix domain-containing protein n=1 Tax=Desulfuromonas sp. TF TaxID=1232410 RepID=UPI000408A26B|nr:helix-turn-helix domain-containing protein [Desulfuromonas sp. TF]
MNTATAKKLEASFLSFFKTAHRVIEIETEEDYEFALDLVEHLITKAEDREGEPLLRMIDMVADSIEKYENSLESVSNYIQEVETGDPGVSTLRVLIDQHNLSYSDLKEEIGSKSLVSQILSGSKNLTRTHIANLTRRFRISPELFF